MSTFHAGRPWIYEETGQLVVYEDADPAQPPHDHVIRTEDGKHVVPVPTPVIDTNRQTGNALDVIKRFL